VGPDFTGAHLQSANLIGTILQEACFDGADLSRARLSGANLVSASFENACLAKAEMEFALMANAVLQGACLREADMSGAQLDAALLDRGRAPQGEPAWRWISQSWTLPTSVMPGLVVRSWSGRRCGVPICGVHIYDWQGWIARICRMPIWKGSKA